jgi:hypothetical protein
MTLRTCITRKLKDLNLNELLNDKSYRQIYGYDTINQVSLNGLHDFETWRSLEIPEILNSV